MDIYEAFNDLDNIDLLKKFNIDVNEFTNKVELDDFIHYLSKSEGLLLEMANLRGNDVKLVSNLPFSLFFSTKSAVHNAHAIRVKVLWNPHKMTATPDGQLWLHGNYSYEVFSHKYKPTARELNILRTFCKKYKVLFAAVWEEKLDAQDLIDYFADRLTLSSLLATINLQKEFDPEDVNYYNLNHCKSLEDVENLVRKDKLWNMND